MSLRAKALKQITTAVVLLGLTIARPSGGKTPDILSYPNAGHAIWLSAEFAAQKSLVDQSAFHPQAVADISYILSQTPVAGCYQAGPMIADFSGGRNPPQSIQDAARSYPLFSYGKVRELTPGFVIGEAGHLVAVEVTEGSRGIEVGQTFFVFLPLGNFTFQGKKICKLDPRYAGLPAVGDELLVFADRPHKNMDRFLTIDYPEAVILISGNRVQLAPALEKAIESRPADAKRPITRHDLLALLPLLQATPFEEAQP